MSAHARLGAVLVLLAAGIAAGQATADPAARTADAEATPVLGRTVVCPDVVHDGDRRASAVTAAGAASRTASPLGGSAAALGSAPVVRDLAGGVRGAFVVSAEGSGAGALTAEQTTRTTGGPGRGVAAVTCAAPGTSSWFVGGATTLGSVTELLLVNVEDIPARVDVQVWTASGPVDARPGRGLTVPAGGRLVVPLDRLAPDRDLLTLHAQTTRGRVAAALRVARSDGRTPLGIDWVPPAQPPAGEAVVPGLPAGPGRRTALVTNPGGLDAVVSVELTTDDGQYVPEGLEAVAVPAGTSVAVDLTEQLATTPAAVRVRSDGPPVVAGGVVVDAQSGPIREIAFSASSPALDDLALLADVRLSAPTEVTLLLSALTADAVVDLVPVAAPGDLPATQRVEVPAATTVAVRLSGFLPAGSTGSLGIEVRPVAGQLHAARYSYERGRRGPLSTLLPVTPSRLTVPRPVVVVDPGAGRWGR